MSKPDPPQPPNPYATAAAATGTNVGTAIANKYLNQVNQVTPQGRLDYNQTGNYAWTDPTSGQVYNIPSFTATQTPSAQQQAIQGQQEAAAYNLAGMANAQSGRVSSLLSTPFDPNAGGPARGDPNSILNAQRAATSFNPGGQVQTQFGNAGDITKTYGPADNFSADRQRVEDSLMQRMNPQLAIERKNVEQRLADQGIRYGSQAYSSAMDDYNRQANDARFAAVGQAGAEQQRMNQMAGSLAAFQNAAQGQEYQQQLGRGTFANEAQQQNYNQNLGAGTFANAAQGQQFSQNATQETFNNAGLAQQLAQAQSGFNANNANRNAYLQEQYTQRNQPINEISALLSGSQVTPPNWINTPGSQIATTDVAGLINQNFNQQMGNYQAQNAQAQNTMGGILGLGAGLIRSDERTKENVVPMGTVFAADADGARKKLPISEWQYKDDPAGTRRVGPMAQDVEKIDRRAVAHDSKGTKYIDPSRVMGSILRAA